MGASDTPRLVFMACGDVGPIHEPTAAYSDNVRETLRAADLRFAQCERVYTELGALQVHAGKGHSRVHPRLASVFADCGFDVVSVASNHALDYGPEALLDSMANLRALGLQTIGAGADLAEARTPAIVERGGVKVAVLAYCSVAREGYWATPTKAGVAPLRAHSYYRSRNYQPGTPPIVVTIPDEGDLQAMREDVAAARELADAVVVSVHWGIHNIPKVVADYQRTIARAAFAHGADLLVGHHTHVPKGVEVIDGRVCFYDLSSFIMTTFEGPRPHLADYGIEDKPVNPRLPYGKDATRSLIVRAELSANGAERVSFLPIQIDDELRPTPLHAGEERFGEAVKYFEWLSSDFAHTFSVDGDEVVVG